MKRAAAFLVVTMLANAVVYGQSGNATQQANSGLSNQTQVEKSRDSSMFSSSTKSVWSLPELPKPTWPTLPGFNDLRERASNSWLQAKKTTHRWWSSTIDFLSSPYGDEQPTDSRIATASSKQSTNGGWFRWGDSGNQETEITTVNEFLKQERPRF